jgi:act minimal PKS ketosynthase (KS/KS alpha)
MTRRVVITGIGVVAPGGVGRQAFWERIVSGKPATRTITRFDPSGFRSQIAAECDFDPAAAGLTAQEIRRLDRAAQLALVSTRECLSDAGLTSADLVPERTAVSIGSAVGCTIKMEHEYVVASNSGRDWLVDPGYAVPHLYDYFVPSSLAREIAWETGAEGPALVVSDGCTAGIDCLAYACELIREGSADVVIAGGTEAPVAPITVACFDAIKATSNFNADPERALRPFDRSRNGFVLGEGAAMFVLEDMSVATRRGARMYAEIGGAATRANAFHMTGLQADGREMAEAIRVALAQARVRPEQIDYVSAHGTATRQNDRHETAAIKQALGEHAYRTPVSSIKSMVGHSLGAIGSIETAACALAMAEGLVPPTANLTEPDPELDLDYVPLTAREHRIDMALNVGSGFGGFQSALVLCRPELGGSGVTW